MVPAENTTQAPQALADPAKPVGQYRCRACGQQWEGASLYASPRRVGVWTCGNIFCGGTVDRLPDLQRQEVR